MRQELITILNANGIDFNHIPGGVPAITEADVLAALAGIEDGAWRLALYLLCGRPEEKRHVFHWLSVKGAGDKRTRLWVMQNKGFYHSLCALAVEEIGNTNTCKPCGGTGMRKIKETKLIECTFCNGTGRKGFTARQRAALAGIKNKDWPRCRDTYARLFNILINWESQIGQRLYRKLLKT